MVITSLQVCMDSSNWLQGTIHEEAGLMDSSSSPSGDILTCSRPLIERRLRPPHDLSLKCPRCDSPNTKFCYYNNYSLSQPRYFCKTCRRYWTKGGTLRNIPVGGGCRKNKKVSSSKKSNDHPLHHDHQTPNKNLGSSSSSSNPTDLQLSNFQETAHQFSQFSHFLGDHVGGGLFSNSSSNNFMLENPTPIDFMDNKYEALVGCTSRNQDFVLGNGHHDHLGMISGYNHDINSFQTGLCSTFGMSMDGNNNNFGTLMDNSNQRLMLPNYETQEGQCSIDVKPNTKMLSLEWHDQQGCSNAGKESFGYLNGGLGSWTGLMNGYGSSATNPLV